MQSPERVRPIGQCKWCGCTLYGRFFMNSLEEMFWQKGHPDCKHYDPDYSNEISNKDIEEAVNVMIADEIKTKDVTCPKCGEPHPVLHCENCGHNWEED